MTQTPEDVRGKYVGLMGRELGLLFHELTLEEEWLRDNWAVYQELFEAGSERIALLNMTAANFFYRLHSMLYEDAMLHLCRLTDPPGSNAKINLTVKLVPDLISDPVLKSSTETDISKFVESCEFARPWRNRRLAHSDLKTVRNEHTCALPSVTSSNITQALEYLRALLLSIEKYYRGGHDIPVLFLVDPWGANSLIACLENAVRAQSEKKNQQP